MSICVGALTIGQSALINLFVCGLADVLPDRIVLFVTLNLKVVVGNGFIKNISEREVEL